MTTLTFDTHDIIKKFREKGLSEDLAEYQVEAIKDVVKQAIEQVQHDYQLDDVTTKRDLKELELALKHDMKELELILGSRIKDTDLKIAETKAELIRWVVAVGLLQITIITGLLLKMAGTL